MYILFLGLSTVQGQKTIQLTDIWKSGIFQPKSISGFQFTPDGTAYTTLVDGKIYSNDLLTGKQTRVLLDLASWKLPAPVEKYQSTPDGKSWLLETTHQPIYRYSYTTQAYYLSPVDSLFFAIDDRGGQQYPEFSPNGAWISWVYDNNLYYRDRNGKEPLAITRNGKKNVLLHGVSDWVYEEELEVKKAYTWSPDSRHIAYLSFYEADVPQYSLEYYKDQMYPAAYTFKYPKVGEKNSVVSLNIFHLEDGKSQTIQFHWDQLEYIPRFQWTGRKDELCVTLMNRLQNEVRMVLVNVVTGGVTSIYTEKSTTYVDIHDNLIFIPAENIFLTTHDQDGWNHIYMYQWNGKLIKQVTSGNWDVLKVYGYDSEKRSIYIQSKEGGYGVQQIYSVHLANGKRTPISTLSGSQDMDFSPGFKYLVRSQSTMNQPMQYHLCNKEGKEVRVLEDNTALASTMQDYQWSPTQTFHCPGADGTILHGWKITPLGFDPTKKYPVLMFVYGGPGSMQTQDEWKGRNMCWFQMLAQKGYIIACVDNRGTGGRGAAFKKCTFKQLGKYETEDQIAAAKWLAAQSYVDPKRIGIFGWSYGGYMSTLCILKGADVFKMAIAVAPVTNWKWYDSIYTERFMQTEKENAAGYQENSPVYFADRLKGKYLLVHGLADDNVHAQNSFEMINALVAANKQFDLMMYPNKNHSITGGNFRLHLFTLMTEYIEKNL